MMARRTSAALLAVLAIAPLLAARKRQDPVFSRIDSIVKSLSSISGMTEEHPVPYGTMSKKQLRHFLRKRIKKTLKPDEIRADELALKMFGLVPQSFDLKKSTIDLLTEQAAAFYDYDEKKLFLLEGSPITEETTTLAHELSHALADQHFDLNRFMDETPANDDENLAHSAVVEGQASWLMIAYDLAEAGKPPIPTQEMLKSVEDSSDTSATDYPVLKASPLYIQQSLLFPYTDGTRFFNAVYQKLGKQAFGAVFTQAPVASSQIMHPERYFAHEKPVIPDLPKISFHRDQKEITDGSLGEFDHRMLLWQYVGLAEANTLAPHLRGAQFRMTAARDSRPVLTYVSQWNSDSSAAEYFTAYKKVLKAKWKHCDPSINSDVTFAGSGDGGYFVTHRQGDTLTSLEGLTDVGDWTAAKTALSSSSAVSAKLH